MVKRAAWQRHRFRGGRSAHRRPMLPVRRRNSRDHTAELTSGLYRPRAEAARGDVEALRLSARPGSRPGPSTGATCRRD